MREIPATAPLRHAEVFVFRAPIDAPVRTSFGVMHDRPAVLLRVEDEDGLCGWGEAWCNFPSCGAEHRGRLLAETVLPSALGASWREPGGLVREVARKLRILRLQADEPGPMDQALACLDIALWDLAARRAGVPLHALLGDAAMTGHARPMPAASIIPAWPKPWPVRDRKATGPSRSRSVSGASQDEANIRAALDSLLPGERLAADVNQAWTLEQALEALPRLSRYPLLWVEEPLACDRPAAEWAALAAAGRFTLAAGENIRSDTAFDAAIAARLRPRRPARRLQMGRPHGLPARGARGPGRRTALLSALSRRRHRPAGFSPPAGRRGRRRPAGSGLQPQSPARAVGRSLSAPQGWALPVE